jgi:26S proteasome regulatory subunit N1
MNSQPKENQEKKADKQKEEELTEEDQRLKDALDLLVERVQDPEEGIRRIALEQLKKEIRSSTSSMTSVPKPLKFLRSHYETLKKFHEQMKDDETKAMLADVISVLAMTSNKTESRDCLNYKLKGTSEALSIWGHEYLRHLSMEIAQEYQYRMESNKPVDDIIALVDQIVPYEVEHNAEPEACDLLLEVDRLPKLIEYVNELNYNRICLYLIACANYVPEEEYTEVLRVAMEIYRKMGRVTDAVRLALRLDDKKTLKKLIDNANDKSLKQQIAFVLARQHVFDALDSEEDDIKELSWNAKLCDYFIRLAKELDVMEPKVPDDIYKTYLTEVKTTTQKAESARLNLASTFVNAFVNAAFGKDKLMIVDDTSESWLYKNKEHGLLSATASIGLLYLWDNGTTGASQLDKYLYSSDDNIKAGALLGIGLLSAGVRNEADIVLNMLTSYLNDKNTTVQIATALGLGVAYAGAARGDIKALLQDVFNTPSATMEMLGLYAVALGLIFVGTGDKELTELFVTALMEQPEAALKSTYARFLCLGLGLLYLGRQEDADVTLEALKAITNPIGQYASLTLETCAYAGTGNVFRVQKMLHVIGEHATEQKTEDHDSDRDNEKDETEKEEETRKSAHRGVAVLGIAAIVMAEEIGAQMTLRTMDRILQYGDVVTKRAVPLALGLMCISNPDIIVMDTLSKLSHDHDTEVAMGAIFSLGLIGAGTNNSRIAQILRQLSQYYQNQLNQLFVVRIAQGLLHMGKGLITLKPIHSEGLLINKPALAGLLTVMHACLDFKNVILGKSHYLLYVLALAMYPRMLMTLDTNLQPLPVTARVGQAVDVIGQAGRPKTITGFQTHNTPVLLAHGERAELATDLYIPISPVLEGFVILKPNPKSKDAKKKKE